MLTTPDAFWDHLPHLLWPVVLFGIVGLYIFKSAVEASETFAKTFGRLGKWLHQRSINRAARKVNKAKDYSLPGLEILSEELGRVVSSLDRMEKELDKTTDNLSCATSYLVDDAHWHHEVDIILAESFEQGSVRLPHRIPYSEYQKRWRDGWRPTASQES